LFTKFDADDDRCACRYGLPTLALSVPPHPLPPQPRASFVALRTLSGSAYLAVRPPRASSSITLLTNSSPSSKGYDDTSAAML
jgi:hypothetical protein